MRVNCLNVQTVDSHLVACVIRTLILVKLNRDLQRDKELTKQWPCLRGKEDVGNVFVIRLQRVKIVRDAGVGSDRNNRSFGVKSFKF
jgi:hypothetical protein